MTLGIAQLVGGLGLAAAVTVGGLVADEIAGAASSGLPLSAAVAGTAVSALLLGARMQRRGRRSGLQWGWLIGAARYAATGLAVRKGAAMGSVLAVRLGLHRDPLGSMTISRADWQAVRDLRDTPGLLRRSSPAGVLAMTCGTS